MSIALVAKGVTPSLKATLFKVDEHSFVAQHELSVKSDVNRVSRKIKRGHPYVLLVTPARIAWRCAETAQTRVDLSSTGCEEVRHLRKMFRKEAASHDLHVVFDTELHHNANCGDHLEDIYVLRVTFTCR